MIAFSGRRSKASQIEGDVAALLARMRVRLYPESIPALASYWLKTVYARGYDPRAWKELDSLLTRALATEFQDDFSRQALFDIRAWIHQTILAGQEIAPPPPQLGPVRSSIGSERLAPYIARLLNEWLPLEVAHLMVNESETLAQSEGIPVLATAKALERLLIRERVSSGMLDQMLEPGLLSPRSVYPAHLEIFHDVVLSLLGRTDAPPPAILPASLLGAAPDSSLPAAYADLARNASLEAWRGAEELHVPILPEQALRILATPQVRIGSILVTLDGRWWESETLLSGEESAIVYRPMGRLRIEYPAEGATLRAPWPENRTRWSGGIGVQNAFEIFGREWRVARWEEDAERTWLRLASAGPVREPAPSAGGSLRRSRPAAIDMAWSALEDALAKSVAARNPAPVESLRHDELIPLGRAIWSLTESAMDSRFSMRKPPGLEARLRAVRYFETQVAATYGPIPWRVLPATVRSVLSKERHRPDLLELVNEVFGALPDSLSHPARAEAGPHSSSPPHAA
jgi:hypothetical protein